MADAPKDPPCVVCRRSALLMDSLCSDCRGEFSNEDGHLDLGQRDLIERVARRAWNFATEHLDSLTPGRSLQIGYRPGDPGASCSTGRRRRR